MIALLAVVMRCSVVNIMIGICSFMLMILRMRMNHIASFTMLVLVAVNIITSGLLKACRHHHAACIHRVCNKHCGQQNGKNTHKMMFETQHII